MPATRLTAQPVRILRFDVVGEDSGSVPNFVRHVGMAREAGVQVCHGDQVRVTHMGPPFENPGRMSAHTIGRQRSHSLIFLRIGFPMYPPIPWIRRIPTWHLYENGIPASVPSWD